MINERELTDPLERSSACMQNDDPRVQSHFNNFSVVSRRMQDQPVKATGAGFKEWHFGQEPLDRFFFTTPALCAPSSKSLLIILPVEGREMCPAPGRDSALAWLLESSCATCPTTSSTSFNVTKSTNSSAEGFSFALERSLRDGKTHVRFVTQPTI